MATETFAGQKYAVVNGPATVKPGAGRLVRIIVSVAGSGGTLNVRDGTGDADTLLFAIAGNAPLGTRYDLDIPCQKGIRISTVGDGQTVIVVYS